jgi:hypothetical protein
MPEISQIPVCKVCPSCGGGRHQAVRPKTMMAFVKDRVCSDCQIQYTPPTPIWASFVFVVAGLVLLLAGAAGFIATIIVENGKGKDVNVTPLFVTGGMIALGILAITHGARSLFGTKRI